MLQCKQPRARKVAEHPPKGPQTQPAPEGGRNTKTLMILTMIMMMIIIIMILMVTIVTLICFLYPKGP